jgi:hypothetical protein
MSPFTLISPRTSGLLRSALSLAAAAGLAACASGCFYVEDDGNGNFVQPPAVTTVEIDSGADQTVTADQATGIYVSYSGGGAWDVYTSCDTATSVNGGACIFTLVLSTTDPAGFTDVAGQSLEPDDSVAVQPDGTLQLLLETSSGLDGATFTTTAGVTVELNATMGGADASALVSWTESGKVTVGAPSNPVDFAPSQP